MRTVFGIGLVLALAAGAASGQEKGKFDKAKLVGKWVPAEAKPGEALVMEFGEVGKGSDTGKLTVFNKDGKKDVKVDGTYKLEGDKLTFTLKFMDIEVKDTITLTKLTEEELAAKDKEGKEESFKRLVIKK